MRNRLILAGCLLLAVILIAAPVGAPAGAQGDLSQTFTSADGSFSFRYPAGWVVGEEYGTILLANSPDALGAAGEANQLAPGQVTITILPPAGVRSQFGAMGIPLDAGPRPVIDGFIAQLGAASFSAPQEFTVGSRAVVSTLGTLDDQTQAVYAVDLGAGGLMVAAVVTAPGEEGQYDSTLVAVIESVQASAPPEPTETGSLVWQQQRPVSQDPLAEGGYAEATALAVGPDDTIYVADSFVGIHVFAPDGTEQGTIHPSGFFSSIADLVTDPDGTLWIIDFSGAVTNLDLQGNVLSFFNVSEVTEVSFFSLRMVLGPDGNFYILNPKEGEQTTAIGEILVFDRTGAFLRAFEIGSAAYFYEANLAFGPDGNLYVAETFGEPGIKVFDPNGALLRQGLGAGFLFGGISSIALAPDGSIYAALPSSPIYHLGADGTLLGEFGESQITAEGLDLNAATFPEFKPGQFYGIHDLVVLSTGDVIAGDYNPSVVQVVRVHFAG